MIIISSETACAISYWWSIAISHRLATVHL